MNDLIIPTIGSKGIYVLKDPFANDPIPGEEYTCQAIRKLSDYIANNEDPFKLIYQPKQLTEDQYRKDLADDMYVVSLQSETGQWLLVPANYLQQYPITNGVRYRTLMLGVSLGALPFNVDLGHLETAIQNLVAESIGIVPTTKLVETSKPVVIERDKHDQITEARRQRASMAMTDAGKLMVVQNQLDEALQKLRLLEDHIKQQAGL